MGSLRLTTRSMVGVGFVVAGMLLGWCPCASALDPSLDVSQYAHTSWKVRDGFAKGEILSIAQTLDGYLWLGTEFGLLRFDGVRAVAWQPPAGQNLPAGRVVGLLATRDGTLWIGTDRGLVSWKDGRLIQYPELSGLSVFRLIEAGDGTVWAGGVGIPNGRLCAIQTGGVHCYGEDGTFGPGVVGLYEDKKGNLWVGVKDGLWRWKPGRPQFYSLPNNLDATQGFAEGDDGALLISTRNEIRKVVNARTEAYPLQGARQQFYPITLLRDRGGGLWVGTLDRGLKHAHSGKTDAFGQSDGLSGDRIVALFEDREGNIWVATTGGLDRFREFAITTVSVEQGLSQAIVMSVLATKDGSVWLTSGRRLNRWNKGEITIPRTGATPDGELNGHFPNSLFEDERGRIWVSTQGGFGYLENSRFVLVNGVPGGSVHGIAEDGAGNLWLANQGVGLLRLPPKGEVEKIPWLSLGHKDHATALAVDPSRGGVWLGFFQGGMAYLKDGRVRASYGTADGLGEGTLNLFRFDLDGTLWAATEGGLSRLKNGRIATLTSKNGLPCDAVHWVVEDDDHAFWMYMPCGLVRIPRIEIDAWIATVDEDKDATRRIQATVFDNSDGASSRADAGGYTPHVAKSVDGKLWFATVDGVSIVDPHHLPFNKLPPPVHIEQITADRKAYDAPSDSTGVANGHLRLPPLIRDLEIHYTALSLVAPEKVLFRYKLEGRDRDWQDAGNRRQAFYSNLAPRNYRFRVMACNNSGVWNEEGSFLDFSVAPAYYQTTWFRLLCVAAFLALAWALYEWRRRELQQQFHVRLEERVSERTRIARELHDTLLQSFQGLLLRFQTASNLLPARPEEAKEKLDHAIEQGSEAIAEGRDAVKGLRSSTTVTNDLAVSLNTLAAQLAAEPVSEKAAQNPPVLQVGVEGAPRELHPILRDEVYRIASEALRNAYRHAQASRIEVEIRYDKRRFLVSVRDDGKGIDPKVLSGDGRTGHFGLHGMRERAKAVDAQLDVWSEQDSGTEVELVVPASIAYRKSSHAD